jgi:hypothetical protein
MSQTSVPPGRHTWNFSVWPSAHDAMIPSAQALIRPHWRDWQVTSGPSWFPIEQVTTPAPRAARPHTRAIIR